MLWGIGTAMSVSIVSAATFLLGGTIGQQQLYRDWTERKLERLATIVQSTDFDGFGPGYSSAAQVYLTGTLQDAAARDSLHDILVKAFGTEDANEIIWRVEVARQSPKNTTVHRGDEVRRP